MSMDLISTKTKVSFYFNGWSWPAVLRLPLRYGWKPQGTEKPNLEGMEWREDRFGEWNKRDYSSSDYQAVKEDDALAVAKALELAMVDVKKSKEPPSRRNLTTLMISSYGMRKCFQEGRVTILRVKEKASFKRSSTFARKGPFWLVSLQ